MPVVTNVALIHAKGKAHATEHAGISRLERLGFSFEDTLTAAAQIELIRFTFGDLFIPK